ncbi:MAG: preprotein translocase subunit SecG [Candidatus Firestonebacteria bacterium]
MFITILTIIHVIVCVLLVLVVLLQSGKAGDLSSVFGGGSSQSLFGPTGGKNVLNKVTTIIAIVFMGTSILLATLPGRIVSNNSLKEEMMKEEQAAAQRAPAPALPATPEKAKAK